MLFIIFYAKFKEQGLKEGGFMARKPLDVLSRNPEEREKAQKLYAYNYRRLYQSASGAWFSFGDEKAMQEALKELARTPYGQNVLANLSPKMELESSNFLSSEHEGYFSLKHNQVSLNTSSLSHKKAPQVLFHELLHAKQHHLGEMETRGYSAGQVMVRSLVSEAEAEGWDQMHEVMYQVFGSLTPAKGTVESFKNVDWLAKVRALNGPSFDEASYIKNDPIYRFHQILRAKNGNLYAAQRAFVGERIIACLDAFSNPKSKDPNQQWKAFYTSRAMGHMLDAMKKGHLTPQGNINGFYQHLDRVANDYGLERSDLTRLNLSQEEMKIYADIIDVGKKAGFHLAEQNASRGWQATRVLSDDLIEAPERAVEALYEKATQK